MRMFGTRKCLSEGIEEFEADYSQYNKRYVTDLSGLSRDLYTVGLDAFHNLEAAVSDAEARRQRKVEGLRKQIAGLQKQIDRLEGMDFRVVVRGGVL